MGRSGRRAIFVAAVLIPFGAAEAQPGRRVLAPPVIRSVFPPGATIGTTVEWTLNGRGLSKRTNVLVSGLGVEVIDFTPASDARAVATVKVAPTAEPGIREVRVEGPEGISNLQLVRIDTLPQAIEVEPNDEFASAQTIALQSSVAGVLKPIDVDHYRVDAPPGREVMVELEARRVGTSITPVLTVLNRRGTAIAQARDARGGDHDCRLAVKVPPDGSFLVQVRDNTYGGDDNAVYRLRVTTARFATGIYPLGGPKGKPLTVSIAGGSLKAPLLKTITLPDTPGLSIDPGAFEGPDGTVAAPGKVIVGDDQEVNESTVVADGVSTTPIALGQTANGRLAVRGELDRYTIKVKKGQKFRVKVQAESLGSWLDSVLVVRDTKGEIVGENDDFQPNGNGNNQNINGVNVFGLTYGTSDSLVDIDPPADDTLTLEVTDRYGEGGPEYGYRLSVGSLRPDFAVNLLIGNPNAPGQVFQTGGIQRVRLAAGLFGVLNLNPGTRTPINFIVVPEGRPGPVTVRVEGLPDGVTVTPVKVDLLGPSGAGGQPSVLNAPSRADALVFNAESYAYPGTSNIRIVATAEPTPGTTITRVASATIGLESVTSNVPTRPITRRLDRFPLRVVGEFRPRFVGPPEAPKIVSVRVPGFLLQGDRIDLGLEFDNSPLADPGFEQTFKALAKGVGLATNTVISSGSSLSDPEADDSTPSGVLVRVLASPKAVPGVYSVVISYAISGGAPIRREVPIFVRAPVEVLVRPEPIVLKPGGSAKVWVGLRRERGCVEEIDLKVEGLPRGVKLAAPVTVAGGADEGEFTLEMAPSAALTTRPATLRIMAVARMPRGPVSVESRIRPMIVAPLAEEKGRGRIE